MLANAAVAALLVALTVVTSPDRRFALWFCGAAFATLRCSMRTKIIAGGLAIWTYMACEPALLRVRWFRLLHGWVMVVRERALVWLRRRHDALRRRFRRGRLRLGTRIARLYRSLGRRRP